MTDRELLAEYRRTGSGEFFAEIVARHASMVHSTCLRILRDEHAAEDATQATFLLLSGKARKLSRKTVLSGWLFRTAQFTALRQSRSAARRAKHEREAGMSREETAPPTASWGDVRPELDAAMAALSAHQQNVVVMRCLQQKPQAEVARELGCSESSVSAVLSRALGRLRDKLARRGVTVPAAALAGMLAEEAAIPAPAALVAAVQAACLGKAAASPGAAALAQTAAKAMLAIKVKVAATVLAGAAVLGAGGSLAARNILAGELAVPVEKEAAAPILTHAGFWRCYSVRSARAMVPASKGESLEVMKNSRGKEDDLATPPPPEGWTRPGFDDSAWRRRRGPFGGGVKVWAGAYQPTGSSLICVRGRFSVPEPGKVRRLTLAGDYAGGLVVYLNGREVFRQHLPEGDLTADTPADPYGKDCYLDGKGKLIPQPYTANQLIKKGDGDLAVRIAKRTERRLGPIALPVEVLVKGVNVLAVEVHRSAFRPEARKWKGSHRNARWAHVGLDSVRLAADAGPGAILPALGRPRGLQVWNVDNHDQLLGNEHGDACESLRPIRMVGARGGTYSGAVAAGAGEGLKGLTAKVSDLRGPGGKALPASGVQVRYAWPTRIGFGKRPVFAVLEARPPRAEELAAAKAAGPEGATVPVWLTVRVPDDAAPGKYAGEMTVSAEGSAPVRVPVEIEVVNWALPSPRGFATFMGVYQSPESVALQYGVELWSEEHWKRVEKSFELLGRLGNNLLVIPLVNRTEYGNDECMIPWIRNPGSGSGVQGSGEENPKPGTPNPEPYTYDFSVFDKYLEVAARHCRLEVIS
ncbi:MAG: RNA polymerase sigma factor, partial [Planctomycetota bacterium]